MAEPETTAAGLRSRTTDPGVPSDGRSTFLGPRVWALGCGLNRSDSSGLNADPSHADWEKLVQTDSYRTRASHIARAIANEDGIGRAIGVITEGIGFPVPVHPGGLYTKVTAGPLFPGFPDRRLRNTWPILPALRQIFNTACSRASPTTSDLGVSDIIRS